MVEPRTDRQPLARYRDFFLWYVVGTVYVVLALIVNPNVFGKSWIDYYTYLLDAFFHGRLFIFSKETFDLSFFGGKWYLYWGPAPVLFILPFYVIGGLATSDIFYTLVAGILNVGLFFVVIRECKRYFKITLPYLLTLLIVLHFAFVSPNLYLSLGGRVWHTEQVIAAFYLLLFLLFYFKFLHNLQNLLFLALSVLFYSLSVFSRYTLLFYGLLFLYPLIVLYRRSLTPHLVRALCVMGVVGGLFVFLMGAYNYARFGSVFETGHRYWIGEEKFMQFVRRNQVFSFVHVPHNLSFYFLNHLAPSLEKPYLKIDYEGNSVFSVYPLLLTLFFLAQKKVMGKGKKRLFLLLSLLVVAINVVFLMFYTGTGYAQFGNRFFFDVIPLLFLLTVFVVKEIPLSIQLFLLFYGVSINVVGALLFYRPALI